jgi:ketosteroid isomerase-like protein
MEELPMRIIEALEDKLQQAMLTSNVAVLNELIADDLVFTMHTGVLIDKQADLETHREGIVRFQKVEISDRQIHSYGNCVVVTLQAELGYHWRTAILRQLSVYARLAATERSLANCGGSCLPNHQRSLI